MQVEGSGGRRDTERERTKWIPKGHGHLSLLIRLTNSRCHPEGHPGKSDLDRQGNVAFVKESQRKGGWGGNQAVKSCFHSPNEGNCAERYVGGDRISCP